MTIRSIAVIGLGAMGLPMAARLAAGGFEVRGFDPVDQRRQLATAAGVRPADSIRTAADGADCVLLAVRDGAQAEQALFGPDGAEPALHPGTAVIVTSTIGAAAVGALAAAVAERGALFVDAPVSGGPRRAGEGDLLVVVGAPDAAIEGVRPVLDRLASTLTIVGPRPGDGQLLKTINQLLAGVHIAAAAEAIALARGAGLEPGVVVEALSTGAAGSFMLQDRGPRMLEALTGDPEVRSRVDIFVKDMALVAGLAAETHVPTPLAAAAGQLYLLAERAGLGAHDDSTVVTLLTGGAARTPEPDENRGERR
ncbi:NAD(P)-dependent oxidoreductase [Gryllotalpicola reticulitermitis]|uniref:NAD(P)-dependent oxidoreductase n=1 Tax=Gryllotalpicola reticulitermitis TaxID=1184153 RepID=A0ABV8Q6T8_9MICO